MPLELKKLCHIKLIAIITSNSFNGTVKLIFNHGEEWNKKWSSISFRWHKIHPSTMRTIIYNGKEILKAIMSRNVVRTPTITSIKSKIWLLMWSLLGKGSLFRFANGKTSHKWEVLFTWVNFDTCGCKCCNVSLEVCPYRQCNATNAQI